MLYCAQFCYHCHIQAGNILADQWSAILVTFSLHIFSISNLQCSILNFHLHLEISMKILWLQGLKNIIMRFTIEVLRLSQLAQAMLFWYDCFSIQCFFFVSAEASLRFLFA